jgi:hypothetical protein
LLAKEKPMKSRSSHQVGWVRSGSTLLGLALAALLLSPSAAAQRMAGLGTGESHGNAQGAHPFNRGGGNVSGTHPFNRGFANAAGVRPHHGPGFQGGRWYHGHHRGHPGWWWSAGGLWYWDPAAPVYSYAYGPYGYAPVPMAAPMPDLPPQQSWFYCEGSSVYYPAVTECPGGWTEIPAAPDPAMPAPPQYMPGSQE